MRAKNFVFLLLSAASISPAFAAEWLIFLQQEKEVPPGLEWSREIVARATGSIRCNIRSLPPFAITLVTDRAFQATKRHDITGIAKSDLLLAVDVTAPEWEREIQLPDAGSYWFIIENRTSGVSKINLRCSAPRVR
jgi:hypothetical protein